MVECLLLLSLLLLEERKKYISKLKLIFTFNSLTQSVLVQLFRLVSILLEETLCDIVNIMH